jgi:hypothetical protein
MLGVWWHEWEVIRRAIRRGEKEAPRKIDKAYWSALLGKLLGW